MNLNWLTPLTASLLFYIIPTLIGRMVLLILEHLALKTKISRKVRAFLTSTKKVKLPYLSQSLKLVTQFFSAFAFGVVTLMSLAGAFYYCLLPLTNYLTLPVDPTWYYWIVAGVTILSIAINLRYLPHRAYLKSWILPALFSILVAGLTLFIWRWQTPYNLDWDLYEHQTLSFILQEGKFSFFTSQLSDTFGFNSYPPTFHVLLAVSQYWFTWSPTQILQFWTYLSNLHLIIVGIASYFFATAFTKSRLAGVFSLIFGVVIFDSSVSFTSLFILPQTLTAVVFSGLIAELFEKPHRLSLFKMGVHVLGLLSLHYVIGPLAALMYIASFFLLRLPRFTSWLQHQLSLIELSLVMAMGGFLLSFFFKFDFINQGEAALYTFTIQEKLADFAQAYGYSLPLLIPLGLFASFTHFTERLKLSLLFTFGLTLVVFSQFPYVLKYFVLLKFFFTLWMALGLATLGHKLSWLGSKVMIVCFTLLVGTILLIFNSLMWKRGLWYNDGYRHVSAEELKASEYLISLPDASDMLLISDPTTQYILEGLTGINSPGGAFMNKKNRLLFEEILTAQNDSLTRQLVHDIKDDLTIDTRTRLLVISGRSWRWHQASSEQKLALNFNIWSPQLLSPSEISETLRLVSPLEPIYTSPELIIFKLEQL